jgi:hypothetical protein
MTAMLSVDSEIESMLFGRALRLLGSRGAGHCRACAAACIQKAGAYVPHAPRRGGRGASYQ